MQAEELSFNYTCYAMVCGSRKVQPKLFKFVVCNLCKSSPSFAILVPLWFTVFSLVFFYLI